MEQFVVFDKVSHYGETLLETSLQINLIDFLNWGFLNIGGFSNVSTASSGAYGSNLSRLRPVKHPNYADGRVWETFRANWVWETGIQYEHQPISISGVFINGDFVSKDTTGPSGYTLNYPLGYVIFNSPISPTGNTVGMEFSFKRVSVQPDDVPWFRQMMNNSYRPDSPGFNTFGSGTWNGLSINRLSYPAVIVEVAPQTNFTPAAIGGDFYRDQDVIFHIFSESPQENDKIRDIIKYQENKTIYLYDIDRVIASGKYALNMNGSVNPNAYMYPELLNPPPNGFRKTRAYFKKISPTAVFDNIISHVSSVRTTFRVDFFKGE